MAKVDEINSRQLKVVRRGLKCPIARDRLVMNQQTRVCVRCRWTLLQIFLQSVLLYVAGLHKEKIVQLDIWSSQSDAEIISCCSSLTGVNYTQGMNGFKRLKKHHDDIARHIDRQSLVRRWPTQRRNGGTVEVHDETQVPCWL